MARVTVDDGLCVRCISTSVGIDQQQQQQAAECGRRVSVCDAELMKRDDEPCNMTELRYDAPLATFDGDEWTEFLDDDDDDDDDVVADGPSSSMMMMMMMMMMMTSWLMDRVPRR